MSAAATIPRRSARHAPSRWVAHFEKHSVYDKEYIVKTIQGFAEELNRPYEEGRYFATGVKNQFTKHCYINFYIFNYLIHYPRFIADYPKIYNQTIKNANYYLNNEEIVNSEEMWAKMLVNGCNEFIEMCSYIHMLK